MTGDYELDTNELSTALAEAQRERDEWKSRHTNLQTLIDEREGQVGAGWWGNIAAKFLIRAERSEQQRDQAIKDRDEARAQQAHWCAANIELQRRLESLERGWREGGGK